MAEPERASVERSNIGFDTPSTEKGGQEDYSHLRDLVASWTTVDRNFTKPDEESIELDVVYIGCSAHAPLAMNSSERFGAKDEPQVSSGTTHGDADIPASGSTDTKQGRTSTQLFSDMMTAETSHPNYDDHSSEAIQAPFHEDLGSTTDQLTTTLSMTQKPMHDSVAVAASGSTGTQHGHKSTVRVRKYARRVELPENAKADIANKIFRCRDGAELLDVVFGLAGLGYSQGMSKTFSRIMEFISNVGLYSRPPGASSYSVLSQVDKRRLHYLLCPLRPDNFPEFQQLKLAAIFPPDLLRINATSTSDNDNISGFVIDTESASLDVNCPESLTTTERGTDQTDIDPIQDRETAARAETRAVQQKRKAEFEETDTPRTTGYDDDITAPLPKRQCIIEEASATFENNPSAIDGILSACRSEESTVQKDTPEIMVTKLDQLAICRQCIEIVKLVVELDGVHTFLSKDQKQCLISKMMHLVSDCFR